MRATDPPSARPSVDRPWSPADGIPGVVARMEAIATALPPDDGVARFNDLYLAVTRAVEGVARTAEFEDVPGVVRLDVAFAGLYFAAVEAADAGTPVSRAWAPLFDARRKKRVAPIQFAFAGMNAHINFDLACALAASWEEDGRAPGRDSAQRRDYDRVNGILRRVEEQVKRRYAVGLVGAVDGALGRVDDAIAIWNVARARDAAWDNAEVLWTLRDAGPVQQRYRETLGRIVGFAGRGLLTVTL